MEIIEFEIRRERTGIRFNSLGHQCG